MDLADLLTASRLNASFPLPPDEPFTYPAALAAGITRHELRRLVVSGLLRRPLRGVYVGTHVGDSLRLRAAALRLVVPPDCVVVDRHAGWLLGAEMALAPGEHLHLRPLSLFRPPGRGRLRNDLAASGERLLRPDDVREVHGLQVTTPLRTAWDLGRVRWTDEAITGLDAMFRLRAFERAEFLAGIERFAGARWVTTLRAVGPLADGRSESPGESVLRLRCVENGLAGVVPQVEVWRGRLLLGRLDLADEDLMAAVEYDGAEWHTSPRQRHHDDVRRAALREAGWLVRAFSAEEVFGPQRTCDRLISELAREARARRGLRVWQ